MVGSHLFFCTSAGWGFFFFFFVSRLVGCQDIQRFLKGCSYPFGADQNQKLPFAFLSFVFIPSGGWVKVKLKKLPHFHVSDTWRDSIEPDGPVATEARAAATGRVSISTGPDPERSGAVEIATRRLPFARSQ